MNIAIDISPLRNANLLAHRVRGAGFYIENLRNALLKYFPENKYIFFTSGETLPAGRQDLPENIDLVHYPYFEPFFLSLPIFVKYKTVVTVHDLTPLVFPKYFKVGIKGNLKWQIQKFALKNSKVIITDSESSRKDVAKYAGIQKNKINVVYLAASDEFKKMDKSSILGSIREKYNLPENFVLYVGDVTWNKNLPRLIKAIKKINIPLVMVGKALLSKDFDKLNAWNKDLNEVQKLIENDRRIIRLGFVSQDDLVSLYNLATVFTMPSLYEGFGLPVLEAMNCGCPVVTTKEGSLSEIAGDAAYFVDAYDMDSIANGIKEVFLNTEIQKKISQKGLLRAKEFTWEKTARETMNVYRSVSHERTGANVIHIEGG